MISKKVIAGSLATLGAMYAQSSVVMANEASSQVLATTLSQKQSEKGRDSVFGGIKQFKANEVIEQLKADNLSDFVANAEAEGYDVQVLEVIG